MDFSSGSTAWRVSATSPCSARSSGTRRPRREASASIWTILAFSFRGRGLARADIAGRVDETLEGIGLAELADAPAHSLSSGQQQLLAVAAVLATSPGLVIADEPTALLDLRNRERIAGLLLDRERPHQLVLVTHDLELAARCDVAVWVREARIAAAGAPSAVLAAYRASVA